MAAAEALSYEPAEQSDSPLEPTPRSASSLPKRGLLATLGFAAVGAVLLWTTRSPRFQTAVSPGWAGEVSRFNEDDPCGHYPFIDLEEVTHSNLNKEGPDSGAEGLVFKAKDYEPGHAPQELLLVVNASATYKAGHAKYNGIHGKYGLITLKAGNEAEFTFKVLDPVTLQPKKLSKQEFTFFDMDQSSGGDNQEYLEVSGQSNVWLTKNTEIQVTELPDGKTKFMSSEAGNGGDNPKDPLALTMQQKNRAVTIEFKDFDELKVTLGCTNGRYARYFMFVARPSLLCAQTVGPVDAGEDEVEVVGTTTAAPNGRGGTTSSAPERDCWFTVPLINFCAPKAWKFWA